MQLGLLNLSSRADGLFNGLSLVIDAVDASYCCPPGERQLVFVHASYFIASQNSNGAIPVHLLQ